MNEFQKKVAAALDKKDAVSSCPRCGHEEFSVGDREAYIPITRKKSEKDASVVYAVPVVILICENCGFLSIHSTLALEVEDEG